MVVFYLIGFVGMATDPNKFSRFTPFILLLTSILLFWMHPQKNGYFYFSLSLIFIAALSLEIMGVQSGILFGEYKYGNALGLKIADTPVIIGLNWVIVTYSSLQLVDRVSKKMGIKLNEYAGAGFAALAMVFLDILIEPIAPKLDYWYWQNDWVPVQNYTAWFFFGFAFCFWILKANLLYPNPMGWRVYVTQFVFFLSLNLLL